MERFLDKIKTTKCVSKRTSKPCQPPPARDRDRVTQATEHKLQLASDIVYGLGYSVLFGASATACALVPVFLFPSNAVSWVMLVPAGGSIAYCVHILRGHLPLNSSLRVSNIGILSRGWLQADRFIPSSDIVGLVWIGKRQWARRGPSWLYSLSLEVLGLSYGRTRIKVGSSHWAGPIGEARDRIIKQYGLQEVADLRVQPVFFWHPIERRVWR